MSFAPPSSRRSLLLLSLAIAACGERAPAVDSGHAPAPPPAALARRADASIPRDLPVRDGVTLVLDQPAPKGWNARVPNVATCDGSCPDSGYWYGPPLDAGLTGVAAHPARDGRVVLIQGSFDASVPFDTVLARWRARLGPPSAESRAAGGDAHVTWQDSITTVELAGTPGVASKNWFLITSDASARQPASPPAKSPAP